MLLFYIDCLVVTWALSAFTWRSVSLFCLSALQRQQHAGLYTAKKNLLGFFKIFQVLLSGMQRGHSSLHSCMLNSLLFQRQYDSSGAVAKSENLHSSSSPALLLRYFLRLRYTAFHQGNRTCYSRPSNLPNTHRFNKLIRTWQTMQKKK